MNKKLQLKKSKDKNKFWQLSKRTRWIIGILLACIFLMVVAFRVSPWPGALVIREVFNSSSAKTKKALERHTPNGVAKISNEQYIPSNKDAFLDVYYPADAAADTRLPTIVWTHGGAWLSGNKTNAEPYYRLLASKGYTVVSLNYSLSPGHTYPVQINQLNSAHQYIQENADRFYVDANKIFLAGDSAGSQLSAQLATLVTNSAYAREVGINPALKADQLKGVLLNCGIYMMEGLAHPNPNLSKIVGWGSDVSVWAYAGTRDFNSPVITQMSPYYYVTKDFPPTFITGGNADPLTDAQSKPLAAKLQSLGVEVAPLFYPPGHEPKLPHEYQFNLDTADGQNALSTMLSFVDKHAQ